MRACPHGIYGAETIGTGQRTATQATAISQNVSASPIPAPDIEAALERRLACREAQRLAGASFYTLVEPLTHTHTAVVCPRSVAKQNLNERLTPLSPPPSYAAGRPYSPFENPVG